jgi:uncharacterized membrane protein
MASYAEMIFASFLALLSLILLLPSWRSLRERGKGVLYTGVAALVAVLIWSPALFLSRASSRVGTTRWKGGARASSSARTQSGWSPRRT